jgi:hypothetical protein
MKLFKVTSITMGIILFLLLAIGSLDSEKKAEKVDTNKTETKAAENKQEDTKPKTFKIGDEIKFDNVIYKVNSVKTSKGSEFNKPTKSGHIFYVVDTTVENKSDKSVTVSSLLMFKLIDSQGYSYNIVINTDAKGQVDGEIQSGKKLRGELSFEVPETEKKFELDVDPSVFGTGKFTINLSK